MSTRGDVTVPHEQFTREECLTRLALGEVGRIVFPANNGINVLPVNYAPGPDHSVIIRSAAGAKLKFAQRERRAVAFHTDGVDRGDRAWWVTYVGHLDPVLDLTEIPALTRLEVDPWADAVERPNFLRLTTVKVSGGILDIGPRREAARPAHTAATVDDAGGDPAIDRNGLEVLTPDMCMRLLDAAPLGRLAFLFADLPTIVPARPITTSGQIVMRARTDMIAVHPSQPAAFQVDAFDHADRTGWSVLVQGVVERVSEPRNLGPIEKTLPGDLADASDQWVRVRPTAISGRRIPRRD